MDNGCPWEDGEEEEDGEKQIARGGLEQMKRRGHRCGLQYRTTGRDSQVHMLVPKIIHRRTRQKLYTMDNHTTNSIGGSRKTYNP